LVLAGSYAAEARTLDLTPADRDLLVTYARDTWRSLDALTPAGGLPADGIRYTNGQWIVSGSTSPTDIAAYLWSTTAAHHLSLIDRAEAVRRLGQTLTSVARLERAHGFFFNWYNPQTGARLVEWPGGGPLRPFLSTVDNGWLAAALIMVGNIFPELHEHTEALLAPMNFGFFYDPYDPTDPVAHPGLLRGGYWTDDNTFAAFHYGLLNTEPRIASYIGIARGQIPRDHYYRMLRVMPGGPPCPGEQTRVYLGVPVVEGCRVYRDLRLVPSWDGTMFEALMVTLFVPEADWAPQSWGINHRLYVRAQIEHGLNEARLGYWGISAATDPEDGYRAFGIAAIAAKTALRLESAGSDRVVTPHASFLALPFAPREALDNLRGLASRFASYGPYGFFDSIDVVSGRVSDRVLSLDQGMIMAAIANALGHDELQRALCDGLFGETIRPLIALEQFEAGVASAVRSPGEEGMPRTGWERPEIAIQGATDRTDTTHRIVKVSVERPSPGDQPSRAVVRAIAATLGNVNASN